MLFIKFFLSKAYLATTYSFGYFNLLPFVTRTVTLLV